MTATNDDVVGCRRQTIVQPNLFRNHGTNELGFSEKDATIVPGKLWVDPTNSFIDLVFVLRWSSEWLVVGTVTDDSPTRRNKDCTASGRFYNG